MPTFPTTDAPAAPAEAPEPAQAQESPLEQVPVPAEAATANGVAQPALTVHESTVRAATFEALMSKARRRDVMYVPSIDPTTGEPVRLEIKLQGLSGPMFDKLQEANPPSQSQQMNKGAIWNPDTFPSALLAECVVSPKLTYDQWRDLSKNPDWAAGEFGAIFGAALRLCQGDFTVSFTGSD